MYSNNVLELDMCRFSVMRYITIMNSLHNIIIMGTSKYIE